jgi:hypothetical protein
MGGACVTCGRDEKCIKKFWSENLKGRDQFEDMHRWEDTIRILNGVRLEGKMLTTAGVQRQGIGDVNSWKLVKVELLILQLDVGL